MSEHQVDCTKPKPVLPHKNVRRKKASPYLVHRWVPPTEFEFSSMALRSLHADEADVKVAETTITESFKDLYKEVSKDVLREAVMAQYAECEVTHYRALSSTWELEKHKRWGHFHLHCLKHFKSQNNDCQQKLQLWQNLCANMGIDVGSEDDLVWHMLHLQTSALNNMQEQYKHIEEIRITRGVVLDSQWGDPPILMKDPGASDPEVLSSSDQETSDDSEEKKYLSMNPPPPSPSLESTPDITASAKVIMYAEMIVKDIFPDRTLAKELARNSLQKVLDSVSASERQCWENDKMASEKVIMQLEGLPTMLCKSFKRAG
ncbi:hypothetical protein SCLCIDRAFT_19635 [Scleroderma citrinum Foug A]|uniref:Uncharacterized protein n=1 Tax=Scleroderma citrinum Foug A TaxID=1036808 RepID=A0A0C3ENT4_9AGAM|nr:hypothetical protein SCLCIDRAFT_19635 [Scleroderma citrinum Foug A]